MPLFLATENQDTENIIFEIHKSCFEGMPDVSVLSVNSGAKMATIGNEGCKWMSKINGVNLGKTRLL
jgi:hypothetical protein